MYRVSVIIPTYNRQDDVILAINSAQNQTYPPFEIILVDDGSTDGTVDRVNCLERPIRYLHLAHSGLPAVARNAGIRLSTGDLIAFLDSDDCWLPDKLEQQMRFLQLNPSIGMVCSNAYIDLPEPGRQAPCYFEPTKEISPPILQELIKDNFVITSTVLIRRDGLEDVGLFSEQADLCALEDYELWLRLAAVREIAYFPTATTLYKIKSKNNLRSTRNRAQHALGMVILFRNLYGFLHARPSTKVSLDGILEERIFHFSWIHLHTEWEDSHRTQSVIIAVKLIWVYKLRFIRWLWGKILNRLRWQTKS